MKFVVTRTSLWEDEKPCKGAQLGVADRLDIRTFSSPEEFDKKFGRYYGKWHSKGTDHTINKQGNIQRTFKNDVRVWTVEISTLEELLEFMGNENIVISKERSGYAFPEIEFYDDYME